MLWRCRTWLIGSWHRRTASPEVQNTNQVAVCVCRAPFHLWDQLLKSGKRHFLPAIEYAGLRRFRFHDLRHTYGSLLIQEGASITYVKEQMRHSSFQVTVDTYGHLIPGANISWVDRLDSEQLRDKMQPARN